MREEKKVIKDACKRAKAYQAWRNPFKVWFVTLFNEDDETILEFEYSENMPKKERDWILKLLHEIDKRRIR